MFNTPSMGLGVGDGYTRVSTIYGGITRTSIPCALPLLDTLFIERTRLESQLLAKTQLKKDRNAGTIALHTNRNAPGYI